MGDFYDLARVTRVPSVLGNLQCPALVPGFEYTHREESGEILAGVFTSVFGRPYFFKITQAPKDDPTYKPNDMIRLKLTSIEGGTILIDGSGLDEGKDRLIAFLANNRTRESVVMWRLNSFKTALLPLVNTPS